VTRSVFTSQYDKFRGELISARESAGLTQAALARKVRRPQSYVSKYERGERRLDVIEFLEIARAIGINVHDFLESLAATPRRRRVKRS